MIRLDRVRVAEAIYAAEVVRAFDESVKFTSFDRAIEDLECFHERAETIVDAWLEMMGKLDKSKKEKKR